VATGSKSQSNRLRQHQRGFAMMLMLLILTLGSLYFLVGGLNQASVGFKRADATAKALTQAKEALIGYAVTYRDANNTEVFGYLPCPDSVIGDGTAAGSCGTADQAAIGLLPYKTLGLPDLRDADGNCLWYAVSGRFKNNPKASLTVMNWDTQGQFSIQDTAVAPDQGDGGAVAVIFATGPPLAGQNRSASGTYPCQVDPSQVSAYLDVGYTFSTSAAIQITQGTTGSVSNNDRLAWISPKEIFDKVVKRQDFSNAMTASPAGQINKLSNEIRAVLEQRIQNDIVAGTTTSLPANTPSYTQFGGKSIGDLGSVTPLFVSSYDNYASNWSNQYRQVACSPLSTACLTLNGVACRGALMFGGRNVNGQPRTSAQQVSSTPNLNYYFEAGSGREILNSAATGFVGSAAYTAAAPGADVATCLFSGSFLSFAQDISSFAGGTAAAFGGSAPVAAVDTAAKTVALGNTTSGTGSSRSGCVWYPTPIEFGSMLRLYFRYTVNNTGSGLRGPGFALALADAGTNNPASSSPILCGATDGARMGYAGAPPSGTATRLGIPQFVSATSWSGGLATVTTLTNHGFSTGDSITISGVTPSGYNGTYTITVLSTTQFSYLLATDPGTSQAGIRPPKMGIEFDTHQDSGQVDPSADHFAYIFWGSAADSSPSGPGNDDNTHYAGVIGSGAEPLNPRKTSGTVPTATPVALLSAASWAGGTVTATSLGPHGFASGNNVYVADVTATNYQGTYAVTATDATHFTYPLAANPGTYLQGSSATLTATTSSASWAGGVVTMNTSAAHGLVPGDYVSVTGISPVGYNGVYVVATTPSVTSLTYALASNPGAYSSGGNITRTLSITSANWSAGSATVTTSAAHGLVSGQYVNIANIAPSGYDGTYAVTVVDATHFTYALAADPGGSYPAASSPTGFATVKSSDADLPYSGTIPFAAAIHVRLDISRSYDTTTKKSTYTLRTYVTDRFANCTLTDYLNLARDLSTLCGQSPTIGQDGVVVSDISTPANITAASWSTSTRLVTVTTSAAHGLVSGQSVNISGVAPAAYNGSYKATVLNATQFTFPLASDPTAYSAGGTVAAQALSAVYFGFTSARGTSSNDNQNVVISNLILRSE
jgi:hypothetical protein